MKVGSLFWALSLLFSLPSATVLALSGSIDRTFKTGTALLLLASLHSVSSVQKTVVHRCADESMICFVPRSCKHDRSDDHDTNVIQKDTTIRDNCKIILKIRAYSAKMYRVVLESRDPGVNEITVTRKDKGPIFSCKAGSEPQYKGSPIKSIARVDNPLMCEFIAKDRDADIFISDTTNPNQKIVIDTNDRFMSSGLESHIKAYSEALQAYCNPADAIFDAHSPGPYSVEPVTIGLTDITCPEHYQLETRLLLKYEIQMESEFIKTTSIDCYKNDKKFTVVREQGSDIHPFEPSETFNVRCAVKTCSLCKDVPPGGVTIVDAADGCKELKCSSGRLKVGQSVGDAAICKKINDKATWDLNGTPIEKTTAVTCETKKECTNASTLCGTSSHCSVDSNSGLPTCTSGQLTFQSKPVTLSCDNNTGKWMYSDGGPGTQLPDGSTVSCAVADTAAHQCTIPIIICLVLSVIILIAIIVGFGIFIHRLRKQRGEQKMGKNLQTTEIQKTQQESKESKSGIQVLSTLAEFPGDEGFGATVADPQTPAVKTPAGKQSREMTKRGATTQGTSTIGDTTNQTTDAYTK